MAEHNTLTDPELHEVKGASTATAGQILTATGMSTATFQTPAVPGGAIFGSQFFSGNSTATSIAIQDMYVPVNPGAGGWLPTVADTLTFSTDHYLIGVAGTYNLSFYISFQDLAGTGNEFNFAFGSSSSAALLAAPLVRRTESSSTAFASVSMSYNYGFAAANEVHLIVLNSDGVNNPTIVDGTFSAILIKAA